MEPSDGRNLSPGFIQLRTPARINICSATQQPPGTKLETIWHRRTIQTTRQNNAIPRGTYSTSGLISAGNRWNRNRRTLPLWNCTDQSPQRSRGFLNRVKRRRGGTSTHGGDEKESLRGAKAPVGMPLVFESTISWLIAKSTKSGRRNNEESW